MSGVSFQHDARVQYRKKSSNPRTQRKWHRFMSKVEEAHLQTAATKSLIFSAAGAFGNNAEKQATFALHAYSGVATAVAAPGDINRDLYRIVTNDPDPRKPANDNTGTGSVLQRKYVFKSCVLDITFRAPASFPIGTTGGNQVMVPNTKIEFDLYEVVYKQDAEKDTFEALWDAADAQTPVVRPNPPVANASISRVDVGATPFQFPELCRTITILKKTKYFIDPGQAFTYQKRFPGNRHMDKSFITENLGFPCFAIAGQTFSILCIIKGVPGYFRDRDAAYAEFGDFKLKQSPQVNITWSATRTYEYTFLDSGEQTADAYNPNP